MYYDFHIHTCLTAAADDNMTPEAIVQTAAANGLGVIAVADYNTCGNVRAAIAAGRPAGVVVIPGMELITAEGIHTLCLFPDAEAAESCAREVAAALPAGNLDTAQGRQILMSSTGAILGEDMRKLCQPTTIPFREVPGLAMRYGGIGGFAHLDREEGSAATILESINPSMSYAMATVTNDAPAADYVKLYPYLSIYTNSDAYALADISQATNVNILEARFSTAETFIRFLRELPI